MKIFSKIAGISILCGICFLGCFSKAATGDNLGTGNLVTDIGYSGSLFDYLTTQETTMNSLFNDTYARVYAIFSKTGLDILKSVDYQSLLCLGVIKDDSLLGWIQKDKTSLIISFKKDFVELENQVLALEEKKNLQNINNVRIFASGTDYESEKIKLKDAIDLKVKLHKSFITNFETDYLNKISTFVSIFQQSRSSNQDKIKIIQDKMIKVQNTVNTFAEIDSLVNQINAKVTGLGDLMQNMESIKSKGITSLDKAIQPLINTNIKKYKKLQNILNDLTTQKTYILGQYEMDFNEYLNNNLKNRYDHGQYISLKNEVNGFKAKFYTIANQLNCSNALATSDESAALLAKINTMKIAVNSGLIKINTEGVSTAFKDQLYSGFQSLYIQKFRQRYTEYTNYLKEYIKIALRNLISGLNPLPSIDSIISSPAVKIEYVFTKPFKSGEYGQGIKALQNLLTTIKLYSGAIDGVYNKATKNAVYKFQLSKGLLVGYEKKPETWGWMGPATRNALNQLSK